MEYLKSIAFFMLVFAFAGIIQPAFAEPAIVEEVHEVPAEIVGGDTDEHGCIATAGYLWSEEKQECVRPWEEGSETTEKTVIEHDASKGERAIVPRPVIEHDASEGERAIVAPAPLEPEGSTAESAEPFNPPYDMTEFIGIETESSEHDNPAPIMPAPDDGEADESAITSPADDSQETSGPAPGNPFLAILQAIQEFFSQLFM